MSSRSPQLRLPFRRRESGLSLVELLVALGLGAFITVGIIQMFTANRETYQVNIGQARLQENARFAVEFLARPIRMAGFTGCFSDNTDIFNVLNDDDDGEKPYVFDLDQVIDGMNATGSGSWSPALENLPDSNPPDPDDADPNGIDIDQITEGTDVLVIRAVQSDGVRLSANMPSSSARIFTTIPTDLSTYEDGSILMISDCEKAAIFQVTQSNVAGDELGIVHNSGSSTTPGNSQVVLTEDGSSFQTDASVYSVQTQIFYIAPGTGTNNRGDAPLSLWRKFSNNAPVELVEGVENLQILYGFDTDGDRVPNRYSGTIAGQDTSTIVTIRLCLTSTSVDVVVSDEYQFRSCSGIETTISDGLLRRNFSKTVALRNRISRGA